MQSFARSFVSFTALVFTSLIMPFEFKLADPFTELILCSEKCEGLTTVECVLAAKNQLIDWLEDNNKYTILIAGKMGTGKTTLIKGFTESYVPGEGNDSLLASTVKVAPYVYNYKEVNISLYDTPGLSEKEDAEGRKQDHGYLKDMVRNEISPDLIIFTVRMDDVPENSLHPEDEFVIKKVSDTFGWARWRFAMFALTYANRVRLEDYPLTNFKSTHHFNKMRNDLSERIRASLEKFDVEEDVVDNIPVVPVGLVVHPQLDQDERKIKWVDEFWEKSFDIVRKSKEEKLKKSKLCSNNEGCSCPKTEL